MNETSKVLNQNEQILWEGQPQFLPYAMGILSIIIFGLIWTGMSLSVFIPSYKTLGFMGMPFIFVLIGIFMLVYNPVYRILVYKHVWYVMTDKRIIFQRGLIGRDFDFVDYDKIESAAVNVDILDKIFGRNSGDIRIYANRIVSRQTEGRISVTNKPFVMEHITDPYAVFELFKKTSFDIKSDINFPNVLRPKENKGYQTEYKPDSQNQSDGQTPPQQ